jgi:NitT/TauT family transport system permease protein
MAGGGAGERVAQVLLAPVALAAWEAAGRLGWLDTEILSVPSAILARTLADLVDGPLLQHTAITLAEMVFGFLAGAVTGCLCGLALGWSPVARLTVMPYLAAIYSIPRPALAPLFVLWFGVGFLSKLILVVTLVYFVFLLHVVAGMQTVEARYVDWMRTLGASRMQILRRVGVPHLLPWLFASTKLGLALALIGAIVGEFISSRAGLGFAMMHAAENLDREGVLSGIFVLSVIVLAIVVPLSALERRLFRWQVDVRV